jgi:hypothetical protein
MTDSYLEAICEARGIADGQRKFFKSEIQKIVLGIAQLMIEDQRTPSRNADFERLKSINSQLKAIIQDVSKMGPKGVFALRSISGFIGPMLSARWINHQFPEDDWAPAKSRVSDDMAAGRLRPNIRQPLRGREYFIDELSLEARYEFVRHRAKNALLTVLGEIERGTGAALSVMKSDKEARGGAALTYRRLLIVNLAILWSTVGKRTATSSNSEFAVFCESICEGVGWPQGGVAYDVPRALKLLASSSKT